MAAPVLVLALALVLIVALAVVVGLVTWASSRRSRTELPGSSAENPGDA